MSPSGAGTVIHMTDMPPIRPARGEPLRCPVDGTRLVEVERSDVMIDACPSCRGVWLDRGEIDRILVKERRMAAGLGEDDDFLAEVEGRGHERRPRDDRDSVDERRQGGRRRKRFGLLEDLLDFD